MPYTVQALREALARCASGATVRAYDQDGNVWDLLAAVSLRHVPDTIALQIRRVKFDDPLQALDTAMVERLEEELDSIRVALAAATVERDYWREQYQRADEKLSQIASVLRKD